MDEPTNDLDVETLELLEELLAEYPGTLLLVSHDRDFLDHVVTSTLVMEGQGRVGRVRRWLHRLDSAARARRKPRPVQTGKSAPARPSQGGQTRRRMSFKEQKELEQLPARSSNSRRRSRNSPT
jgi:ATP-binding cassette subfamily F protein uup